MPDWRDDLRVVRRVVSVSRRICRGVSLICTATERRDYNILEM